MNCLAAIQRYLEPYEVSDGKLEILLIEQGLQPNEEFRPADHKTMMYKALISALWSLVTLTKEKDNGSELNYDVSALKELIKHYQREIDEPIETKPQNRDMTHYW